MCKSIEAQNRAIDNFFEKLRDENYTNPKAIYEDRDVPNLIGFAAVIDSTILNFFKVEPDDSVRCNDFIPHYGNNWGNKGIAMYFGGDYAVSL